VIKREILAKNKLTNVVKKMDFLDGNLYIPFFFQKKKS